MAEEEKQEKKEEPQEKKEQNKKNLKEKLTPWIVIGVIVLGCGAAGFTAGKWFGSTNNPQKPKRPQQNETPSSPDETETGQNEEEKKLWYYDMNPVVANLDDPGVRRYVRASITLAISTEWKQEKATDMLKKKEPVITDWLTVYLASLSLEEVRGKENLRKVQQQILDTFNNKLFPDSKPKIKKILFREFAIQ